MFKKISKLLSLLVITAFLTTVVSAGSLTDISGNKNQTAIQYLYDKGVISGYPDGTFQADKTVNRAELIKILVGGKGITPSVSDYKNCFPDVKEQWFAPYICYAKTENWISGYPDGTFKPEKEVNKVEALKMLVNSQGYELPTEVSEQLYTDVDNKAWYASFVQVAKSKGLLEESSGSLGASNPMKRGGISENIFRAMIISEKGLTSFSEFEINLYLVSKVVDGDTIDVSMNGKTVRVRLIGVDTPETVGPNEPVGCFGKEASDIAKLKLLNQKVVLEADESQGDKDKYDRLLRYVILVDGTNFNEWLISNGYGHEYTYDKAYKYQEDFQDAELNASESKVGLWADNACSSDSESDSTTSNDGYKFYVSSKAKSKYYCETDPAWEELSKANLLEYDSEEELKKDFPNLVLNQEC